MYEVSQQTLEGRFEEWKSAMLQEVSRSMGLDIQLLNTKNFEIDSVHKYYILLSGMTGLLHTRFRGEARYHKNPCLPIIARNPSRGHDIHYELAEIQRFKETRAKTLTLDPMSNEDITWWMLAQHYTGFETRLLDITRNPQIALFFACEKHPNEDGYVYVFHSTNKTSIDLDPNYHGYVDHIVDKDNYYPPNEHVYLRPNVALDRINRQESEFFWVKNYEDLRERGLYETKQIIPIIIKKEHKAKIMQELLDPHGISWQFLGMKQS